MFYEGGDGVMGLNEIIACYLAVMLVPSVWIALDFEYHYSKIIKSREVNLVEVLIAFSMFPMLIIYGIVYIIFTLSLRINEKLSKYKIKF